MGQLEYHLKEIPDKLDFESFILTVVDSSTGKGMWTLLEHPGKLHLSFLLSDSLPSDLSHASTIEWGEASDRVQEFGSILPGEESLLERLRELTS